MKSKLGYEGEKKRIGIIYIIWIMVLIPAFFRIINALKNNNFSFWDFWFGFLVLIGFGLLITLIYIPTYIEVRKNLKNIDLLKIKGKKAKGIIKEYSSTHYISVLYFDEILKSGKIYIRGWFNSKGNIYRAEIRLKNKSLNESSLVSSEFEERIPLILWFMEK